IRYGLRLGKTACSPVIHGRSNAKSTAGTRRANARSIPSGSLAGSFVNYWLAEQVLGALNFDQNGKAFLLGVAVFFRFDQALPDLIVQRTRLIDGRNAIKPGYAGQRQDTLAPERRVSEKHRYLGAV